MNRTPAPSLRFSRTEKICRRSLSAPPFQMISGMPPFQKPVAQRFPSHTTGWIRLMVIETAAQELDQAWVLILLKHDLIKELFGKNLLFLGRSEEHTSA